MKNVYLVVFSVLTVFIFFAGPSSAKDRNKKYVENKCRTKCNRFKNGTAKKKSLGNVIFWYFKCDDGYVSNVPNLKDIDFQCDFDKDLGDFSVLASSFTLHGSALTLGNITCKAKTECPHPNGKKQIPINMKYTVDRYILPVKQAYAKHGISQFYSGDTFLYTCNEGYKQRKEESISESGYTNGYDYSEEEEKEVKLTTNISCGSNGQWRDTQNNDIYFGYCQKIQCDATSLANLTHGNVTNYKDNFDYGDIMTIKCDPGFEPKGGHTSALCLSHSSFTLDDYGCQETWCPEPAELPNGEVSYMYDTLRRVGDTIQFKCDYKFQLVGKENWTCQANGQWDASCVVCSHEDSHCPAPCIPPGARINYPGRGLYKEGATVELVCNKNTNSTVRTCMRNRRWSGSALDCTGDLLFDEYVGYELNDALKKFNTSNNKLNETENVNDTVAQGRSINVAQQNGVDVYLVIDASKSITNESFNAGKDFIKALLPQLGINTERYGTRLALIYFATKVETKFNHHYHVDEDRMFQNAADAQEEIDKLTLFDIRKSTGEGTDITEALDSVSIDLDTKRQVVDDRLAQQVLILISDGVFTQNGDPEQMATQLKENQNVEIYSIFVTDELPNTRIGMMVMERLATQPKDKRDKERHFFAIKNANKETVIKQMIGSSSDMKCGTTYEFLTKISNDDVAVYERDAEKNAWPWMVQFFRGTQSVCGGSVIDDQWILTAAHCFILKGEGTGLDKVVLKSLKRELSEQSDDVLSYDIKAWAPSRNNLNYDKTRLIIHRKYDSTKEPKHEYDIALLRLDTKIQFDNNLRPVCLWDADLEELTGKAYTTDILTNGTYGVATGWGKRCSSDKDECAVSSKMKQMQMMVQDDDTCTKNLTQKQKSKYKKDIMFCAGDTVPYGNGVTKIVDTCQGDSGGPFVVPVPTVDNKYVQIGIVSFGFGCKKKGKYGIYTKLVPDLLEWMKTAMKKAELTHKLNRG